MEWTRESRYKKYSEWDAETLLKLQAQATASKYQMSYHIRPQSGLLNDPNGFSSLMMSTMFSINLIHLVQFMV